LHREDIVLSDNVPHVVLQPHPWRTIKTAASERKIPLVGASFWAASRIKNQATDPVFAFPRYNRLGQTNGNSASAALNKWLKLHVPKGCCVHSFRHSMRDRLRAVNCSTEMIDQIGGWSSIGTVGSKYGQGYDLGMVRENLEAVRIDRVSITGRM
jgi:integrase